MTISDQVIISEGIAHKGKEILKAISKGKKPSYKVWYAVTTADKAEDLMFIISSTEYRHPIYRNSSRRLLGLAGSRKEACDIVMEIVKKGYDEDAITHMKQFVEEF